MNIEDKIRELLNNTQTNSPINHNYFKLTKQFNEYLTATFPETDKKLIKALDYKFYEMCHEYDGRFGTTTQEECVKIIMDYKKEIGL